MNKLIKINKNKYLFWSIIVLIFLITWYLTSKTPLYADDYNYKMIWGSTNRITSINDIFISQYRHYFGWGGRSVAHTLAQLFLFLNKGFFNFFNAIMFILLNILIYCNASGKRLKNNYNVLNLIIIYLLLWNCMPVFGECVLWLTGSMNYLWTTVIILAFLLPYRFLYSKSYILKNNKINIFFISIFGIIAGWTNENTAIALISLIILILFCKKQEGIKLPKWTYFGLGSSIIGFTLMVIAPGNAVRSTQFPKISIMSRIINFINTLQYNVQRYGFLFLFLLIILISIVILNEQSKSNKNNFKYEYLFSGLIFIVAFISTIAMFASPYFPERSLFGTSVFIIISIMVFLFNTHDYMVDIFTTVFKSIIILILGFLFLISFRETFIKLNKLNNAIEERNLEIVNQANNGIKDVKVKPIEISGDKHICFFDLSSDINDWRNQSISNYFKINSLKVEE